MVWSPIVQDYSLQFKLTLDDNNQH